MFNPRRYVDGINCFEYGSRGIIALFLAIAVVGFVASMRKMQLCGCCCVCCLCPMERSKLLDSMESNSRSSFFTHHWTRRGFGDVFGKNKYKESPRCSTPPQVRLFPIISLRTVIVKKSKFDPLPLYIFLLCKDEAPFSLSRFRKNLQRVLTNALSPLAHANPFSRSNSVDERDRIGSSSSMEPQRVEGWLRSDGAAADDDEDEDDDDSPAELKSLISRSPRRVGSGSAQSSPDSEAPRRAHPNPTKIQFSQIDPQPLKGFSSSSADSAFM